MTTTDKIIPINCDVKDYLEIGEFEPLQGNLKNKTADDLAKLKGIIIAKGFDYPLFVAKISDKNYTLDGHGRDIITSELKEEGYKFKCPDGAVGYWLPVVYVFAVDKKEAKEKLLYLNSRYGKITETGLFEFLNEKNYELNFEDIKLKVDLPELSLRDEYFQNPNFKPATENEQGKLDEKKKVTCPNCGEIFEPS